MKKRNPFTPRKMTREEAIEMLNDPKVRMFPTAMLAAFFGWSTRQARDYFRKAMIQRKRNGVLYATRGSLREHYREELQDMIEQAGDW